MKLLGKPRMGGTDFLIILGFIVLAVVFLVAFTRMQPAGDGSYAFKVSAPKLNPKKPASSSS